MSFAQTPIIIGLMLLSLASTILLVIKKPWRGKTTIAGILILYLPLCLSTIILISTIIIVLPDVLLNITIFKNVSLPETLFAITSAIGIITSLLVISNTRNIAPFISISENNSIEIFSIIPLGLLIVCLKGLFTNPTSSLYVYSALITSLIFILLFYIIRQGYLILNHQKLIELTQSATFKHLLKYPMHYPKLRASICSIWTNLDKESVFPKNNRDYALLSEKLLKEYKQANDRIIFFTQDMNKYLRDLNITDKTGMITAVSCICKLSVYHPTVSNPEEEQSKIKRQILHDLIHSCNQLLRQSDDWDIVRENREHQWEVLHGYRVLEFLLIKTIDTIDYDLISSAFREIYTTLLRNHENINATLFVDNTLNDITIIKWIQDRMDKYLHFTKDKEDNDRSINLKLITYSSILRICVGRIDKLLLYLQDAGEDEELVTRCNNLIDILIEQIHSLALSKYKFHKNISVALFFLIACFSRYRYSKLAPTHTFVNSIWKKLEYQSRFMIKYHIGNSQHKGIDFFSSYVCLLQFLKYNPIPLIPWKVRNYTFIEIETLMDDLLGYFERYLMYLDPEIPSWERNFIGDNLVSPNWIFFNSPSVTIELLDLYIKQFTDKISIKDRKSYTEFMGDRDGKKSDLKPRFIEKIVFDLSSTQID
jgi:hypothetical protein